MNNDLWNNFIHTGSVSDYLKYKHSFDDEEELSRIEITNANYNKGLNNQRTDDRRE